ncbi:MAG: response regulator [Rhodocyclales bacterium GT-UBC]|nr:MAG: response regulator [Rhodocyclales bacterium GT-UBC]
MSYAAPLPQGAPQALVVEDNPVMRVLLSSMLMHRGFSVTEDSRAETALDHLRQGNFDLVMLDIMLFQMSGIELCHLIREDLGLVDLPVIACTSHADPVSVAHMRLAGFNDILPKPVDGEALDKVLREIGALH